MTSKQFIEKAIEGGWLDYRVNEKEYQKMLLPWGPQPNRDRPLDTAIELHLKNEGIHQILLDPKAWQAVGKVEGWDVEMDYFMCTQDKCDQTMDWLSYKHCPTCGFPLTKFKKHTENWKKNMHRMIDALCEGKNIEDFLATL